MHKPEQQNNRIKLKCLDCKNEAVYVCMTCEQVICKEHTKGHKIYALKHWNDKELSEDFKDVEQVRL